MSKYERKLLIESYQTDVKKDYKAFSLMCDAQEIGNAHATSMGLGYDQLIQNNIAWVLSRFHAQYIRVPLFQEEVILSTWHKGEDGLFSIRDYEIRSSDGSQTLVQITTSWLLIHLDTRKIQRIDRMEGIDYFNSLAVYQDAIAERCPKLTSPSDMQFLSRRSVLFSDLDYNNHANNAKYIEWVIDSLDPQLFFTHHIDSYQINYAHEAHLGDVLDFYIATISAYDFYLEGRRGPDIIFQASIKLKP